jgi:hypothetical protein
MCTLSQLNFLGTNGNVFELFDVGLYEGSIAPDFVIPDYSDTMQQCRQYFWTLGPDSGGQGVLVGAVYSSSILMGSLRHPDWRPP